MYSFLKLIADNHPSDGRIFYNEFKARFETEHGDDLRSLSQISLPEHVLSSEIAKIYRGAKYRLTINSVAFHNLIRFLEAKDRQGGAVLVGIIQEYLTIVTANRTSDSQFSLAQILNRARDVEQFPAEDEGIPGHNPGSANTSRSAGDSVLTKLKLGPLALEEELSEDTKAELELHDKQHPPLPQQSSLVAQFETRIKQEQGEEGPLRVELQLPPSSVRDVAMEVQKVKEDRDRFRIGDRTGGKGPAVSVTMFTFHNTYDRQVQCYPIYC